MAGRGKENRGYGNSVRKKKNNRYKKRDKTDVYRNFFEDVEDHVCKYHAMYGTKAKNCNPPCNFLDSNLTPCVLNFFKFADNAWPPLNEEHQKNNHDNHK